MRGKIIGLIYNAVAEMNRELPDDQKLPLKEDTPLAGGSLDSLGFVDMIVRVEQAIHKEFGKAVTLAGDDIMTRQDGPFSNIGSLADHIDSILSGRQN
ncbi:MAG: acyl carrier protein [Elusimicrobia bacterium HGW-Elusimicrobia-1]|nr:MAG: acyl carrier protein [Elusimicrobia bacterium HGW-Elusimicrobia-1]